MMGQKHWSTVHKAFPAVVKHFAASLWSWSGWLITCSHLWPVPRHPVILWSTFAIFSVGFPRKLLWSAKGFPLPSMHGGVSKEGWEEILCWVAEMKWESFQSMTHLLSPAQDYPSAHGGERNLCPGLMKWSGDLREGRGVLWRAAEMKVSSQSSKPLFFRHLKLFWRVSEMKLGSQQSEVCFCSLLQGFPSMDSGQLPSLLPQAALLLCLLRTTTGESRNCSHWVKRSYGCLS